MWQRMVIVAIPGILALAAVLVLGDPSTGSGQATARAAQSNAPAPPPPLGATSTPTPSASPIGATTTPTPSATSTCCQAMFFSSGSVPCQGSAYLYSIGMTNYCPSTQTVPLSTTFQVATDTGPWTTYAVDNETFSVPSGVTAVLDGRFVEPSIPPQYTSYRILAHAEAVDDCWTWDATVSQGLICRPDTPTPSATTTPLPTVTPTPSATTTPLPLTGTPPPTATPCAISFSDVQRTDYFYAPVRYLYCHGVISGYADGTFRPYANTTRAQQVKIVILGFQQPITTPGGGAYSFADVPPPHPFFAVIETAAADNIVSGYTCGGLGEPCDGQHRPYFRPSANVTRGQLAKIDVLAAGWAVQNPPTSDFTDVAPGSAFYPFVETAFCQGVISGYACGSAGEPCDPQQHAYFRQYNSATRGQISKIVYLSVTGTGACGGP